MDINYLFSALYLSTFGFNWIDILIIIILLFYCFEGYGLGFYAATLDLISFVSSFAIGLTFYGVLGKLMVNFLSIPNGFANAIGFFIVAFLSEVILNFVLKQLVLGLPLFTELEKKPPNVRRLNNFLGIIPSVFSALVLVSFILTMIIILPVSVFLKHSVSYSRIGNFLVTNTQVFAKDLNSVFGGAVNETLAFLTVEPKSNQLIKLNFATNSITIDEQAEGKMFALVNQERQNAGVSPLEIRNILVEVARNHCKDMLNRGYFSHYTPEGLSPFDRMAVKNITFTFAGENLALAPNTDLAMKGLMQSPGHRANILSADYHRVGIGVYDAGVYGEMFCQEFSD
jgi:uncharacterized protein YkwD